MSKSKSTTKPVCGNECFNCFQQGLCDYTVEFRNSNGSPNTDKPLHFCSLSCRDAYVHEDTIPTYLAENQKCLEFLDSVVAEMKTRPKLLVLKKVFAIEKMLRISLVKRKSKAELHRLFALWQECATETLGTLGDKHRELVVLEWAEIMKEHDKVFPAFIAILGR